MAEQLGSKLLPKGSRASGEHALLAQLGCGHVQGFGIGRPMPADQITTWIKAHNSRIADTPKLDRRSS